MRVRVDELCGRGVQSRLVLVERPHPLDQEPALCALPAGWHITDLTFQKSIPVMSASTYATHCPSSGGGCGRPHVLYHEASKKYILWVNSGEQLLILTWDLLTTSMLGQMPCTSLSSQTRPPRGTSSPGLQTYRPPYSRWPTATLGSKWSTAVPCCSSPRLTLPLVAPSGHPSCR